MTTIWEYGGGVAGGSPWVPGGIASSVNPDSTLKSQVFSATAGQQLFTLTTFAYALASGALLVTVNGVTQINSVDYTETTTASITFTSGLNAGDIVHIMGFVGATSTFLGVPVSSSVWCGTAVASGNNFILSPAPAISGYVDGQRYLFYSGTYSNPVAGITCAISGLTALNVVLTPGGTQLFPSQVITASYYELIYNATFGVFILGEVQSLTSRASTLLLGGVGANYLIDAGTDGVKLVSTTSDVKLTALNGSYVTSNAKYVGGLWTRFNDAAVTYKTEVTSSGFKVSYAAAAVGNIAWTDLITVTSAGVTIVGTTLSVSTYVNTPLNIGDYGTEAAGIDVNGVVYQPGLRINDIGGSTPAQVIIHRHSTTLQPLTIYARTNTDNSSHAAVTAGQILGSIFYSGHTGTHYDLFAAIEAIVDAGTISSTSSPGKLVFYTTPAGSNTLVARMTIDNSGNVGFSTTPRANTHATARNIELGSKAVIYYDTTWNNVSLGSNGYLNSSGAWAYSSAAVASMVQVFDGKFGVYTAPAGALAGDPITWSAKFNIDNNGNVGFSTTPHTNTHATWRNLELGPTSQILFNSDSTVTHEIYITNNMYYNGTSWVVPVTGVSSELYIANNALSYYTAPSATAGTPPSPTLKFSIDNNGNVGFSTTPHVNTHASARNIELGGLSAITYTTSLDLHLSSNATYRTASWYYNSSAAAARFEIINGTFQFYTAPSGTINVAIATWVNQLTVNASGVLLAAATSGAMGSGTINATGLYRNGIEIRPVHVSLGNSTNQTITTGTVYTSVLFNLETLDDAGTHSTSVNTSRITIPTGFNRIHITGYCVFTANSTGARSLRIIKNGSFDMFTSYCWAPSATDTTILMVTGIFGCVAGDYFELGVTQTSGGNLDIGDNSAGHYNSFQATLYTT